MFAFIFFFEFGTITIYQNMKFLSITFCLAFILSIFLISNNVFAQAVITGSPPGSIGNSQSSNPPPVKLDNPLGPGVTDVPTLIGRIIKAVLGIVGSLALVMFIYGGFTWMLAAGSSEKVKKGRDIIVWAAIGLVIIFTSYALVSFIIESVGKS